jgi:cytochrome b
VVGVRLSKYVVTSVTFAQWFIKEGDNKPLRAIGYVAAFLVFIISGTISILGRTLS